MNYWTQLSIDYANKRNYLDNLFAVYPTIPEGARELNPSTWESIQDAFEKRDNIALITHLLQLELFPIKDSYVAYFKRDKTAIARNNATVNRLAERMYSMGLDTIYKRATEAKETNRQIGPLFRRWVQKGNLGVTPVSSTEFFASDKNAILDAGDTEMMHIAREHLGYKHEKGLDFVARFNGKYVVGEAKFLTDFGGHQNAQFNDAIATATAPVDAVSIAILDGVLYIPGNHKMYKTISQSGSKLNILSALVLKKFLHQL